MHKGAENEPEGLLPGGSWPDPATERKHGPIAASKRTVTVAHDAAAPDMTCAPEAIAGARISCQACGDADDALTRTHDAYSDVHAAYTDVIAGAGRSCQAARVESMRQA